MADFRLIPVNDLKVDPAYQRTVRAAHVNRIVKNFDPEALGVLIVSERRNGNGQPSLFVVDGQHRLAALRQLGWREERVPCLAHVDFEQARESRLFNRANTRLGLRAIDRFRARLVSGDPDAQDIVKVVEGRGLQIGEGGGPGQIGAVNALEKIYRDGGDDLLDRTLGVVLEAWGPEPHALNGEVLRAIGGLLRRFAGLVDQRRLIARLQEVLPAQIAAQARALYGGLSSSGEGHEKAWLAVLARIYNKGLRGASRLPEFDPTSRVAIGRPGS